MNGQMTPNRIPAQPIAQVLRSYLDSEGTRLSDGSFAPGSVYSLAQRVDMNGDTLEKILAGRSKTIDFDDADKLLCVTNLNDLWATELRDLYQGAVLHDGGTRHRVASASGKKVCARRGCSALFLPNKHKPGQKFCSNACRTSEWSIQHKGIKTRLRGKGRALEALSCPNGHERTKENTKVTVTGARRCKICERARGRRNNWKRKKPDPKPRLLKTCLSEMCGREFLTSRGHPHQQFCSSRCRYTQRRREGAYAY